MNPKLLKTIRQVLAQNPSVVFASLYGSSADTGAYNYYRTLLCFLKSSSAAFHKSYSVSKVLCVIVFKAATPRFMNFS